MTAQNAAPSIADGRTLDSHYPAGVTWASPIEKMTLSTMFDRAVKKYADKVAINFLGRKITYEAFDDLVNRAAKGFQDMGVKKGTRIGFYMPNTPWYPVLFFGALKAGGIVVNYSPQYAEKELLNQVKDSGTSILVTSDLPKPHDTFANALGLVKQGKLDKVLAFNLYDSLPDDKSWLPSKMRFGLPVVKVVSRLKALFNFAVSDKLTFINRFIDNDGRYRPVAVGADDTAVLQYTGGTTGVPKGAELTHANLTANVQQISAFLTHREGMEESPYTLKSGQTKMMGPLPDFHVFGLMTTMITPVHLGLENQMTLDPRDIPTMLKFIERARPDTLAAVPKLVEGAWKSPEWKNHDLSSLKSIVTGGSAMPTALHRAIHEQSSLRVFPGWGLTETSPVLTVSPVYGEPVLGSAGQVLPGVEVRVCDISDSTKVLPLGEKGELQARGPHVMKGYWNKPDETANVMTDDCWFRTGDIGYLDARGLVYITDRLKRMINISGTGKKAWASVIENEILEHPDILECVVVAINKGTDQEAAKAFVRFAEGKTLTEAQIREHLASRLSKLEIPKHFEFVSEPLPQTSVGKPDWKKLEDQEAARSPQKVQRSCPLPS